MQVKLPRDRSLTTKGETAVKRNSRHARRTRDTLRLWTLAEARAAAPYIASVVRSIREHALDARNQRRQLEALSEKPGRPDRTALIAWDDISRQLVRSEDQFRDATEELESLDVYCLDPIQGQGLVPFVHEEQLAWYIFDLFDTSYFRSWRYQSDPEEMRRNLSTQKTH
jgi:hypothetical protein